MSNGTEVRVEGRESLISNVSSEGSSEPLRPAREPARKVQQSRPGHRPLAAFEVITEAQHGASLALLCSFLDLGARCVPD